MSQQKTALITGVLGQDGRLLTAHLLDLGYRVVGVARAVIERPRIASHDRLHLVAVDLADTRAVQSLLAEWQPGEIYHLAAAHHSSQENPGTAEVATKESMLVHNFLSTRALAFALLSLQSTAHLIFAASSQMYTPRSLCDEIDEGSPRNPRTFYGYTKSWSLELLAFLRSDAGLRASTAILFNHESPLRSPRFVTRKITQAAARAKTGAAVRLELFNLGARVDWSSAHDVVRALHLMATRQNGREYIVASGELHSVRELLEIAFGHVGLDWRAYTSYQFDREEPALLGNPRLLHDTLGWRRNVNFSDLITAMVEHDLQLAESNQA